MIRTFIYGSCVSRDTFEFLNPDRFTLVEYLARQSILSALSPAPEADMPRVDLPSAFQRRMLENDWRGSLLERLTEHREHIDLVLWDLCDERHGVFRLQEGPDVFVTRSVEGMTSGLDTALEPFPTLRLGSESHLRAFRSAARRFGKTLDDLGLRSKTLVVAPEWAETTMQGHDTPSSFGLTATAANQTFRRYLKIVAKMDLPVVGMPSSLLHADADHRWGLAPFHYDPSTYQTLAAKIEDRVA
ncbi:DUF6270 domain-containing protein [uncultured Serinicoccus sp.]|uniref:DUF6270 domain-containing protein n=1 Tax=uncultured Serinicoccus sp. TaxID=735514 RepID=UPI00260DDB67|nr:DUF6270 domain-containing protein [uncultured Serinicoccus sp.]